MALPARLMRRVLLGIAGVILLLLAAAVIVSLFRIPISLTSYKGAMESALTGALQRQVRVDGDIVVTTSLWPYFEISELRIANPEGMAEGDFASMELARVSVGLLPLLQRRLQVNEFRVEGLTLQLLRDSSGESNWVLESAADAPAQTEGDPQEQATDTSDKLAMDKLRLEDIRIRYSDADREPVEFVMDSVEGSAAQGEPMDLTMQGQFLEEAFSLQVEASSLGDFLAMTRTQMKLDLEIAGARLHLSGLADSLRGGQSAELGVLLEGADLSSLDSFLGVDLPPLQDYRLGAAMRVEKDSLEFSALEAGVGSSLLSGRMLIDTAGSKPIATLDLTADSIRLEDFDTGDWSAESGTSDTELEQPEEEQQEELESDTAPSELLSQDTLQRADARFTIDVGEVRRGDDLLGSGELRLTLRDGRIDLDPLQLKLPESRLLLQSSLKPGTEASDASLRILIENFDFGALVRLSSPDSEVGGTLNMDVDITAAAGDTASLLGAANGYFDIAGHPQNLESGLVDLWAVNLLTSVVSSSEKGDEVSQINCMLSRFRLEDGVMTAEQLVVDTSRIRICGEGQLSFRDETFNLVVGPKAKRAEFFSLATPLAVRGSFEDFSIGTQAGVLSIGGTAVNFVISPVTTPIRRVFLKELPEDGADVCGLPIGRREEALEAVPGC